MSRAFLQKFTESESDKFRWLEMRLATIREESKRLSRERHRLAERARKRLDADLRRSVTL